MLEQLDKCQLNLTPTKVQLPPKHCLARQSYLVAYSLLGIFIPRNPPVFFAGMNLASPITQGNIALSCTSEFCDASPYVAWTEYMGVRGRCKIYSIPSSVDQNLPRTESQYLAHSWLPGDLLNHIPVSQAFSVESGYTLNFVQTTCSEVSQSCKVQEIATLPCVIGPREIHPNEECFRTKRRWFRGINIPSEEYVT